MSERLPQVAGVILLRDDGAALMQHRDDKPGLPHAGMWVPPGGHCERDEAIEACARREFQEETGYRCGDLKLLTAFRVANVTYSPPIWLTMFWCEYDNVQRPVCLEGQALEFVRREDAHRYRVPTYLADLWELAWVARELGSHTRLSR